MESILNTIVNAENVRMLVLLAFGYVYLTRFRISIEKKIDGLDHKIDGIDTSLNKRIDNVEASLNRKIDSVEISLNRKIDNVEASLNRKIDCVEASLNKKIEEVEASLNHRIDMVELSLNRRIDSVEASLSKQIYELKNNDFVHLNVAVETMAANLGGAIQALTYALEKNNYLSKEDKEYVDGRLSR